MSVGGGVLFELEEFDHFLPLLRSHFLQDVGRSFLGQVGQQVGGGVGIHLLDDVGGAVGIERLHDCLLHLGIDLFQGLGGHVVVQSFEHGFAFVGSKVLYDVGDVGRMQAGETLVGDFQLYPAGGVGFDEVDKFQGIGRSGI